jgi:predicted MFS family arabinose efflux permease
VIDLDGLCRIFADVKFKLSGLWLQANFRRLWAGQATSLFANMIVQVALPLTAVVFLEATPIQMGVIGAMAGVPAIVGIFLGVWVDRRTRGPILVMVDLGRMFLLLTVPVAYAFDALTMELLYFVALGIGAMSMLFEIAYRSFLPSVVRKTQLVDANSKLEFGKSGSVAVGPAVGGAIVEVVAAPLAVIAGAAMYFISALFFRSVRVKEAVAARAQLADGNAESVIAGVRAGFGFFRRSRALVGVTVAAITLELFGSAFEAIYILFLVRNLEFTPVMIGLVFSAGGLGFLGAAFVSSWLVDHIGVGGSLVLGFLIMAVGGFLVPLAAGPSAVIFVMIFAGEVAFVLGAIIWNIGQVSLRQAITPETMLGRVTSIQIVATRAGIPIGAMVGGFLGEILGLRAAIFVFSGGITLGVVWLFVLGVWRIRELPDVAVAEGS